MFPCFPCCLLLTQRWPDRNAPHRRETVVVTLAASLLSSNEQIVAAPALRIAALRGNGALGGPLLSSGSEMVMQNAMEDPHVAAEVELEISIGGGDGWAEGVGDVGHRATIALLHSLKSLQGEGQGWNAVVSPLLGGANVSAPVNGTVRLRLPQICSTCERYSIEAPCVQMVPNAFMSRALFRLGSSNPLCRLPLRFYAYAIAVAQMLRDNHQLALLHTPLAQYSKGRRIRFAGRRSSWSSPRRHCCRARRLQLPARSSSTRLRARCCSVARLRTGRWRRSS